MTPETPESRRIDVLAIFDELVDLDWTARQERYAAICADDPELQMHIERLIAADASAETMLAHFDDIIADDSSESDPLHVAGTTVSHFRVIEPIARGGMGIIYRAEDTRLGRIIALKFPLAFRHVDSAARERFRHEARVAAALDHPNLCPVYEIDESSEGDVFYTMPLYGGETLKARLAQEGKLPQDTVVDIASNLARGLSAAHRAGVVHRDLKPGNVMLLPDGAVKILDFGLARASDATFSDSKARLGTISYMAPEQIHDRDIDRRADLWALGVVLYEMVTGTRPFSGGNETEIARAILHEQPRRASELRKELDPELTDLIDSLLQKDPAQRPQSADEVDNSLRHIRVDESGSAHRSFFRRTPVKVGAALIVVSVIAAASIGILNDEPAPATLPVSMAVLPFEWTGDSSATEYLAIGMSDGLATDLARLQGVKAPSYLTAAQHRGGQETLSDIGNRFQVEAVLRGRVARTNQRVRVEAQLLNAKNGLELWSQVYERPVTDVSQIERDIARSIVRKLRVRTSSREWDALKQPATLDGRAYDAYLRGRAVELTGQSSNFFNELPPGNIRQAISLYSQAHDIDPGFAPARAALARMQALAGSAYDTTEQRREQSRAEAEISLRLSPGLPDAFEALAYYWALKGDLPKSIESLRRASEAFPHSAELHLTLAEMLIRLGSRDEAAPELNAAMRLAPGSARAAFEQAINYSRLRRREQAMRGFNLTILLAPDFHIAAVIKGHSYLRWKGTADTLDVAVRDLPPDWDPQGLVTYSRFTVFWIQRRYAEGLAMLASPSSHLSDDGLVYQPVPLMRAQIQESMGERKLARASYAVARSLIADSLHAHPDDAHIRVALALADAGLGRSAEAVHEARRAVEIASHLNQAELSTGVMGVAAEVFAKAGDDGAALDMLELLFSMSAGREVTAPYLRVWPGFDPLRADPRFNELLARFSNAR